jgi:hypothetical protein
MDNPEIDRLRLELEEVRQPLNGWPEPEGRYARLMDAESHGTAISWLDLEGPGVLRDVDFVAARHAEATPQHREHLVGIFAARQELVWARVEAGELQQRIIVPDTLLTMYAAACPEFAAPTAQRLLDAIEAGFDIRMAGMRQLTGQIGRTSLLEIAGEGRDKEKFVYRQYKPGVKPHEVFLPSSSLADRTMRKHDEIADRALPAEEMRDRLARFADSVA